MPTEKRNRKRAARDAKRAAMERQRRRRATIRRVVTIVVIVGIVIGIYVLVRPSKTNKATATIPLPAAPTSLPAAHASTSTQQATDTATATAAGCPADPKTPLHKTSYSSAPAQTVKTNKLYDVNITTDVGTITAALDPSIAPKTVNSFVFLARHHYFDCVIFHRVIQGFVIQGGDPTGTGTGGPGYQFADELPKKATPQYPLASMAMANSGKNTNGSQFFIIIGSSGEQLAASYSLFGQVTSGFDAVAQIAADGAAANDPSGTGAPAVVHRMLKVTVTTS
ncbi:MAG TPA: peptidylprolyl isomerase [Acidimicrobiales bacterium]|nr:peptidylprolyl isomerase [Acidimicrobiales bacterium]